MPDILRGFRGAFPLLGVVVLLALVGCDEDPEIHHADSPAVEGGVQVELLDYELRYLELTGEEGGTIEYPDPVLALEVEITNVGEDDYVYEPAHDARQMAQSDTPMLYDYQVPDDPETIDWQDFSPDPIPGVDLEEGDWERQLDEARTLEPDESLTDYLLFEPPEADQLELLLSMPPAMHRGETPTFIQFDYDEPEPVGREVYEIGDTLEFDGVRFTVEDITQEYVELKDGDEEGFGDEPVLKLSYVVENETDEPVEYAPGHDSTRGDEGPMIRSTDIEFDRFRIPGEPVPVDQETDDTEIEPDESIEDFALFERPTRATDSATFVLSADHIDRTGTIRVDFSFEPEAVDEPEELE